MLKVKQFLETGEKNPALISVGAGSWRAMAALKRWRNESNLKLSPAAATSIASTVSAVARLVACPLILQGSLSQFFGKVEMRRKRGRDVVYHTAWRLYKYIIPREVHNRGRYLAHPPLDTEETNAHLKHLFSSLRSMSRFHAVSRGSCL